MTTTQPDRILTLDTIRGVAVMGILLMNIVGFGLIEAAYMNPRAQGGSSGADLAVYLFNFVLFDGKMRGLFSFLFGASTLLVIDRATAKGESPARIHYARMVWLLIFGLLHLWLVWYGDILAHYALIGMLVFLMREQSVGTLILIACILIGVETLFLATIPAFIAALDYGVVQGMSEAVKQENLANFDQGFGVPPAAMIARIMATMHGSYVTILAERFKEQMLSPLNTVMLVGMETFAYMLFGMAGLKSGMLTGAWPRARYVKWLAIGFGIGIPAYVALAVLVVSANFSTLSVAACVLAATVPLRPLMIVGWASLIILLMRPGGALTTRIAAAGRMAFSNYLLTSVLCTTIFYGYGFGLFGTLHRVQLYLVVTAVWAAMLLWSKPWLERFAYGPLEWLWRSLSRGSLQTMTTPAIARRTQ